MDKKGDKMTKLSMNKFINMAVSDMNRRNVMEPNFDKYPDGCLLYTSDAADE